MSHRLSSPYHRLDRPLSHSVPSLVGAIALARLMPRRPCPHTYGIRRKYTARRRPAEESIRNPLRKGFCESRADRVSESTKFFRKAKKGTGAPRRVLVESIPPEFRIQRGRISNPRYIVSITTNTSVCAVSAAICLSHPRVFRVLPLLLSRRRSLSPSCPHHLMTMTTPLHLDKERAVVSPGGVCVCGPYYIERR